MLSQRFRSVGLIGSLILSYFVAGNASAAIINGGFETGDLTGWTPFDDPNGTANGDPNSDGLPEVVSFDVTGSGASSAVLLRVGRTTGPFVDQGGGLFQTIETFGGELTVSVDYAVEAVDNNGQGGLLELAINGNVVDMADIESVMLGDIFRGTLDGSFSVGAGTQEVRLSARRRFGAGSGSTPMQYFDNVSASGSALAVPEPATGLLIASAAAVGVLHRRRRTVSIEPTAN